MSGLRTTTSPWKVRWNHQVLGTSLSIPFYTRTHKGDEEVLPVGYP